VPNLRDNFHWSNTEILLLGAASTLVAIGALWYFGKILDRVGSKPLLDFACILTAIHFGLWFCLSAQVVPFHPVTYFFLAVTSGLGGPVFNLANSRLAMSTVPEMGRSHFFALFSVVNSLTLGLLPIGWGILLDVSRSLAWRWEVMTINNYSAMYLVLCVTALVALGLRQRLHEARAMSSDEFFRELLVETPSRAVARLFFRRWFP
jgi:MFS family permease